MKKNIFSLIGTTLMPASIQQPFVNPTSLTLTWGDVVKEKLANIYIVDMTNNQLNTGGTVSRLQGLLIDLNAGKAPLKQQKTPQQIELGMVKGDNTLSLDGKIILGTKTIEIQNILAKAKNKIMVTSSIILAPKAA